MRIKFQCGEILNKIKSLMCLIWENVKLIFYRILDSSLWWQIVSYSVVNIIACFIIYQVYAYMIKVGCEPCDGVNAWESVRLFVGSNGILGGTKFCPQSVTLLVLELVGTVLFSGLMIAIITNAMAKLIKDVKSGRVHYAFKDHVVIIGYDKIVPSIIKKMIQDKDYAKSKIILQTNEVASEIRNALLNRLSKKDMKRVVIYYAPRQSQEELRYLCTIHAKAIFVVGDRAQSDHDAENMNTFANLVSIHKDKECKKLIPLTIWFENEASYTALQLNDVNSEWKSYFEFRPYNFYKRWANRLLTNSNYGEESDKIIYPELDHAGIGSESKKHVHLIILGMNRMGVELAKEVSHLMHFPNFKEETGANRTRITFIDDHADVYMNYFIGRHPGYFDVAPIIFKDMMNNGVVDIPKTKGSSENNFLDIQFEFIKGRIESNSVREWIKKQLEDQDAIISIAICLHNPAESFAAAMYLPDEVYLRGRDNKGNPWMVVDDYKVINIFIRQETTGALVKSFGDAAKSSGAKNKKYANIYPFGMIDDSFAIDNYSNKLAIRFNYIYDYYNTHNSLPNSFPSEPDLEALWSNITTSEKWSNLYLADSIEFKLRSFGYDKNSIKAVSTLNNEIICQLAYVEHCRWNVEKLLVGYRPYDDSVDGNFDIKVLKKNMFIHPLIKPYNQLDDSDKVFDKNFIEKLPDILRSIKDEQ